MMLRKTILLLLLVTALVLTSCGGNIATEVVKPEEKAVEAPKEDAAAPKEEATAAKEVTAAPKEPSGEEVNLVINSWRNDDLTIWQDTIIPAFNKKYPNIKVAFSPDPPAEYNAALNTRLEGGTAGDLITCRPFDASLSLYDKGYLTALNDLPGIENFSDVAKSAWITDDGKNVFCVPMASVIHGFLYNKDAFKEVGIEAPKTETEFFSVLEKIKANGAYVPLVLGTKDQWESATMGFQNIGPNYWKGEEGRKALIAGTQKFTDQPYIDAWKSLAKWAPYLGDGYKAQTYPDSQNLFVLGKGAIFALGSWDISTFKGKVDFEMGVFPPPIPDGADKCYISDHTDIALGMNTKTKHPAEVKKFLEWMTSSEFAELYANSLPGFFSLSNHSIKLSDPLAQEVMDWRKSCVSTIRNSYQILSRGEPNLENELWRISSLVINGDVTPEDAAKQIQAGLEKWYKPGK